jgi:hypothetical protein
MKNGKVKVLAISHKNGKSVLRAGDKVTENDVLNFDKLVKDGYIDLGKEQKQDIDLMKLTKPKLQEMCTGFNIEYEDSENKAILVDNIEKSEEYQKTIK